MLDRWFRRRVAAIDPAIEGGGHPHDPVLLHARRDFATLRREITVAQAMDTIRSQVLGERIIYFYLLDADDRLTGVLPVRRLLTAPLDAVIGDLAIDRVEAIPDTATVLDACEYFHTHRFLALPVVDAGQRLVGVVDIDLFAHEIEDIAARVQVDEAFESIGFRVSQLRRAGAPAAFTIRFPWLLATIFSGTLCA